MVISESTLWEIAKDIKKYLKLIIKVVTASSIKVPQATIISRPANCPALVRFVRDIRNADITESPFSQAKSPKVKDTERYARAMGTPSLNPFNKLFSKLNHRVLL